MLLKFRDFKPGRFARLVVSCGYFDQNAVRVADVYRSGFCCTVQRIRQVPFFEVCDNRMHLRRLSLESYVMHAANAAHGSVWPVLGKVEERKLVTAAHIEKDMC